MAEREGFEPPIPLRVCLISSQVHSTGLCHLSAVFTTSHVEQPESSFCRRQLRWHLGIAEIRSRRLLLIQGELRKSHGHVRRPMPQKFSGSVQIHASHNQSTCEGKAIAMPCVIFELRPLRTRAIAV
jgi:hypothetical protein